MKLFLLLNLMFLSFFNMCGDENLKAPAEKSKEPVETPKNLDQSKLPKEMPDGLEIGFNAGYGMTPAYKKIVIKSGTASIEEKSFVAGKKAYETKNQTVKISAGDLAKLYQFFVENDFDTIKNDQRQGIVYDAPSESIYIRLTDQDYYQKSFGDNEPISGENLRRYQNVRKAIFDLTSKSPVTPQTKDLSGENQQIFPFDAKNYFWAIKDGKPAELNSQDIDDINKELPKAVAEYNATRGLRYGKIENFPIYKRQIVPFLNPQGEKAVWINCVCNDNGNDWRKSIIVVDDGGSCYFNLKINLTTKKVFDFMVNGRG